MTIDKKLILVAGGALILGGFCGYLINEDDLDDWGRKNRDGDSRSMMGGMHRMPDGSMMMNSSSGGGMMKHGMMMVTSEKEFITEMIPHHQEAIDTAKEVLARGATTPEIRALAEGIVAAQEKEIADMKTWHEAWFGTPYQPSGNYEPMMRDLSRLSGKELDKAFLEDMVHHHMGAIMMAHSVRGYIEHDEMKTLTKNIVDTQSDEIEKMQDILRGL